ncbi:hypothetical protein RvY_18142 [Ramazzottius varieornatus]|uniref:HTH psq-type domain-containing protein n=1 Tax=Ramazzottius varieornatus TaxID=947166 RepID=A0A1D1W870_RAMVA|nr:hypothetical protein RvY_18142 [Ramazzottius varieornatus]
MAANRSPVTSATSEDYPSAPAQLQSMDIPRKRRYVQAHPDMEAAVTAVNDGMSIRMAAERYQIPHTTLANKVNGKHGKKAGRPSTFTMEEEEDIAEILVRCSKIGVPLGKRTLIKIVKAIAIAKGMNWAKFTDRWHRNFLRRNRGVSVRVLSALSFKKSREWTAQRCEEWISLLQKLNESGFRLAELYDKVYAERGVKEAVGYLKSSESDRENISLLAMGNAAGKTLRPLILYKGKMHLESHFRETHDACYVGTNSSGVMDTEVLTEFLEKEFLSSITCPKNVLIFDGHSSHLSCIAFLLACMEHEKEIQVVVLPSGQTAFLQPLDKEVFGGVKQKWHMYLRDSRVDTSIDVSGPMKEGFRKTGMYPFDAELLRGTVNPRLEVVEHNEAQSEEYFADIAKILREKIRLSEDKTTSCLLEIRKIMTGESVGSVVAVQFYKNLLRSAPQKKRREKDSRLDVSNGRILTESAYISTKKAAMEKNKAKAKGLRNRKRNIQALEESATGSDDDSPATQEYPCQSPPKRQRKTAQQVAAEIANDVPAPQSLFDSPIDDPEVSPLKTRAKRATARTKIASAPRKKPSAPASKAKAKILLLPKTKPRASAVKSKAKNT